MKKRLKNIAYNIIAKIVFDAIEKINGKEYIEEVEISQDLEAFSKMVDQETEKIQDIVA